MRYVILCLLLTGCQAGASVHKRPTPEENRLNKLFDATVQIHVRCDDGNGSGSGVTISTTLMGTSKVLTAAHLDSEMATCTFEVVNHAGHKFPAKVLKKDVKLDLMVLDVEGTVGGYTPPAASTKLGKNVTCVGYPAQRYDGETHLSISKGVLATEFGDVARVDASFFFGSSGGPCFDDENKVVGIISFMFAGDTGSFGEMPIPVDGQYFVASLSAINKFLDELYTPPNVCTAK